MLAPEIDWNEYERVIERELALVGDPFGPLDHRGIATRMERGMRPTEFKRVEGTTMSMDELILAVCGHVSRGGKLSIAAVSRDFGISRELAAEIVGVILKRRLLSKKLLDNQ